MSTPDDDTINEALQDAICDGDGRPRPDALRRHLAKHGLAIVDANAEIGPVLPEALIKVCDEWGRVTGIQPNDIWQLKHRLGNALRPRPRAVK